MVVKRVRLCKIQYVELHSMILPCVTYFEEVPLSVTVSVYIILEDQIVLIVANLHRG